MRLITLPPLKLCEKIHKTMDLHGLAFVKKLFVYLFPFPYLWFIFLILKIDTENGDDDSDDDTDKVILIK